MARDFSYKVYDTNGATPAKNVINHMNARAEAQNNLTKGGGGGVVVPQFRSAGPPVTPNDSNANISRIASAQMKMDNTNQLQGNTGKPIGGKKSKKKRNKRNKKRKKSCKNYLTRLLYGQSRN
jgi:hypothetical protein